MSFDSLASLMPFVWVILGVLLLFFGRTLYWLFVAVVGFLAGMQFAGSLFSANQGFWMLVAGVLLGLLGAALAVLLQRIAVILGAAGAAGLVAMHFAADAGLGEPVSLIVFLIAAVAAAVLAAFLFDWALIAFSAAIGASLIIAPLSAGAGIRAVAWLILVIAGFLVQSRFSQRARQAR